MPLHTHITTMQLRVPAPGKDKRHGEKRNRPAVKITRFLVYYKQQIHLHEQKKLDILYIQSVPDSSTV